MLPPSPSRHLSLEEDEYFDKHGQSILGVQQSLAATGCYVSKPDISGVRKMIVMRNEFYCDESNRLEGVTPPPAMRGHAVYNHKLDIADRFTRVHVASPNTKVYLRAEVENEEDDLEFGGVYGPSHPAIERILPVFEHFSKVIGGKWDAENKCYADGLLSLDTDSVRDSSQTIGMGFTVEQGPGNLAPVVWTGKNENSRLFAAQFQLLVDSAVSAVEALHPALYHLVEWGRTEAQINGPWNSTTSTQMQLNYGAPGTGKKSQAAHIDGNDDPIAYTIHINLSLGDCDGGHPWFHCHNLIYFILFGSLSVFSGRFPHEILPQSEECPIQHPDALRLACVLYVSKMAMKPTKFMRERIWDAWQCRDWFSVLHDAYHLSIMAAERVFDQFALDAPFLDSKLFLDKEVFFRQSPNTPVVRFRFTDKFTPDGPFVTPTGVFKDTLMIKEKKPGGVTPYDGVMSVNVFVSSIY